MSRCLFGYRRRKSRHRLGVSPDFLDFEDDLEAREEREFNQQYPNCWDKFLHWLGW